MAPVDGGLEASRRMHEYLLSKQRKQEEFWLRKYGKVLQAPPPSVSKANGNPRLPPVSGSGSNSGQSSARGSNSALASNPSAGAGGLLPPLPGVQSQAGQPSPGFEAHPHRQPKGHAPIFHANEPVKDFFSRNARQPRASITARDEYGSALPPSHRPPEPYRARGLPAQLPPMAGYGQGSSETGDVQSPHQSPQPQEQEYFDQTQEQQQQQSPQHYGGFPQHQHHQHANQHSPQHHQQASPRGYIPPPRVGVPQPRMLPPLAGEASSARSVGSGNGAKPLRNLEMELVVIRAIKAREDVLERLRIASGKLDSGFGGSAPVVLSPVDPLVRLFYRLVGTLRQRTLDVIEAIAAWRRKVNPTDPFIYYGVDYLAAIGPDVSFLDELPFMRTRLTFTRAADDPFLAEVTPDGIPIEEATTCDLRRGGQRFSSDALRIRMARKVLAHYCGRPMPGSNAATFILDGGSSAMSGGGLQSEPSQPRSVRSVLPTGQGEDEEAMAGGGMTTQQIIRALSPPVPPVMVLQPTAARAITPPAVMDTMAVADSVTLRQEEEEQEAQAAAEAAARREQEEAERREREEEEEEEQRIRDTAQAEAEAAAAEAQEDQLWTEEEEAEAEAEAREKEEEAEEGRRDATEGEDVRAVGDQDAFEGSPHEPQQQPADEEEEQQLQQQPQEVAEQAAPEPSASVKHVEDLVVFDDDNGFIDFALGAIIHSLEQPFVDMIPPGNFTVSGWEIDRQLDEVVRGIASPDLFSRNSVREAPPAAAAAAARGTSSSLRRSIIAASPSPLPVSGMTSIKPPSRGTGRIPHYRPLSQPEPEPPSRGQISDGGTAAAKPPSRSSRIPAPPSAPQPPVRVHLQPRGSGLDMALSMDDEGPMGQVGLASSLGRPTSRGSSSSINSIKPSSTHDNGLPSICEDQSAMFNGESRVSSQPPVRVHLRPRSSGLDMDLSLDPEEMEPQVSISGTSGKATASANAGAAVRPPVRVHLNPRDSGLDMALSMDDEGPMGQVSLASSLGRPTSRGSSSNGINVIKPVVPSTAYDNGLGSISEDQSAMFGDGGGLDGEELEEGAGAAAPRPPVRVHLNPTSRDLSMVLSMDDDGMLMASPAAASEAGNADTALAAPVPRLDDIPTPLQGSLSGRGNRASLRQGRQSGSRPGSSASASVTGEGLE